jgi:putative addiction module component (TIGR02574 family)
MNLKTIEDAALALPTRSRARLAKRLILSLDQMDSEPEDEVEREWQLESERRSDDLKTGRVKGITFAKVLKKARAALR